MSGITDSIATAKSGTSLVILSSGGGKTGIIASMVSNLTDFPVSGSMSEHFLNPQSLDLGVAH